MYVCTFVCMYTLSCVCAHVCVVCVCMCVCGVCVHVCVCVTCASACSVFEDYLLSVEQLCVYHYYPDKCNWANGLLLMSWKGHFQFNLALDTYFRNHLL